jgi:hypothetical protein
MQTVIIQIPTKCYTHLVEKLGGKAEFAIVKGEHDEEFHCLNFHNTNWNIMLRPGFGKEEIK